MNNIIWHDDSCNIQDIEILEEVLYVDLIGGKTDFKLINEEQNLYEKAGKLYISTVTYTDNNTKVMVTPIDFIDKIRSSNFQNYKYDNFENWKKVANGFHIEGDNFVTYDGEVIDGKKDKYFNDFNGFLIEGDNFVTYDGEVIDGKKDKYFNDFKVVTFAKTPERGFETLHTELIKKLVLFKVQGYTIVFRIMPTLEPYYMVYFEDKKIKWGFVCSTVITIVKNPRFVEDKVITNV